MSKRVIAFIICVAMLIGVLPTVTLAATRLDFVGITDLDAPVAGVTPDYSASHNLSVKLDSGNNSYVYYKNGICWYDLTTSSIISTTTKFVEGHQYKAVLYLKATESYSFANNIEVTVNNMPATVTDYFDQTSIVAEIVFDPIPSVTSVTGAYFYTARTPVAGDLIQEVTLVYVDGKTDFGDILDNWDGAWYVNNTKTSVPADYEPYNGNKFIPNVAFAYRVEINLKDGYAFENNANVGLNVTTKIIDGVLYEFSNEGKTAIYYFFLDPLTAQPINDVSYTLSGYEYGSPISQITIDSTDSVITSGSYGTDWFITISNRVPIMTGNFNYDTVYTLYIKLRSATHDVSGLTKYNVKVNGKQASAIEQYAGEYFAITYLPVLTAPVTEIGSVHLLVDVNEPTAGADFFFPYLFAVNGNESMTSAVQIAEQGECNGWYEADYFTPVAYYEYVPAPATFKNGKAYNYYVELYPNEGCVFADDCIVVFGAPGGLWQVDIVSQSEYSVCCEFYYNLGAPTTIPTAQNVKVTLEGYEYGKAFTDIDVGVKINDKTADAVDYNNMYGMLYGIMDESKELIESGSFEYDKQYFLSVILSDPKYDFSSLIEQNVKLGSITADDITQVGSMMAVVNFKLPKLTASQPAPCISGHSFTNYVYNNDATTQKDGTKTAKCDNCAVTDTVTATGTKWTNPFTDVKAGKFYYDSVLWAVNNSITSGVTPTTFEPNSTCTRAQVVSFLWRAAGSPEPKTTTNPFTDVKAKAYYYKAVLWAVENGITSGVSATSFAPNDNCTRGQIVAFLWRSQGSPKVKSSNPFTDVKSSAYYYDAVLWAVQNNVTSGMSATSFAPKSNCTRGQIVSFLYRCLK